MYIEWILITWLRMTKSDSQIETNYSRANNKHPIKVQSKIKQHYLLWWKEMIHSSPEKHEYGGRINKQSKKVGQWNKLTLYSWQVTIRSVNSRNKAQQRNQQAVKVAKTIKQYLQAILMVKNDSQFQHKNKESNRRINKVSKQRIQGNTSYLLLITSNDRQFYQSKQSMAEELASSQRREHKLTACWRYIMIHSFIDRKSKVDESTSSKNWEAN